MTSNQLRRFNPLPSPKQGETRVAVLVHWPGIVSIRSPHQSKGRLPIFTALTSHILFQSAPLTKARGDPFRLRGPYPRRAVSIRSPHQSKGRRECACFNGGRVWRFNPLPSPKQGETALHRLPARASPCFNPLPSPKQGETGTSAPPKIKSRVSIRSPHQSKGRPCTATTDAFGSALFQSAPLTKARGDPGLGRAPSPSGAFQSAPLTKARGDPEWLACSLSEICVSIRSPHQSKGRP